MAKLDKFDAFSDPTPAIADGAATPEKAAAPSPEGGGGGEVQEGVTGGQEATQTRQQREPAAPAPAAPQPVAAAAPPPVSPEELARWEHWLNAAAGKFGKTLAGTQAAAQAWRSAVAAARTAGVGEFPITAAAMRALGMAPNMLSVTVTALADVPHIQQAVLKALEDVPVTGGGSENAWLHE